MVEVKNCLEEFGESVFMVSAVPGQSFAEQTMQGLTQAKVMVAFCTSDYGQKTGAMYETYQELQFAYEKQLPIVPVKLSTVYPPEPPEPMGTAQNRFIFKNSLVYIDDSKMEKPDWVANEILLSLMTQGLADDQETYECRRMFRAWNLKGDGLLTEEEVRQGLGGRVTEEAIQLMVDAFHKQDIDGDGKITFEEFKPLTLVLCSWKKSFMCQRVLVSPRCRLVEKESALLSA